MEFTPMKEYLNINIFLFFVFLSLNINAKDMDFNIYQPCMGSGDICSSYIFADGDLKKDTSQKLHDFLDKHDKELPDKPAIFFNSSNGDIEGGIELAKLIRLRKMNTYVGKAENSGLDEKLEEKNKIIAEKSSCYSACAFAFLGGVYREIDWSNGEYSFFNKNLDTQDISIEQISLEKFFDEMGFNKQLLFLIKRTKELKNYELLENILKQESREMKIVLSIVDQWNCNQIIDHNKDNLVKAYIYRGKKNGSIVIDDANYTTPFSIKGFDKRWDFDLNENSSYNYSFVISLDGIGSYYDFSMDLKTKPKMIMNCYRNESSFFPSWFPVED